MSEMLIIPAQHLLGVYDALEVVVLDKDELGLPPPSFHQIKLLALVGAYLNMKRDMPITTEDREAIFAAMAKVDVESDEMLAAIEWFDEAMGLPGEG